MDSRLRKVCTGLVALLALVTAAVFLAAWLRWGMRCDEGCYLRSAEPGAPWTRYRDSWQWHVHFGVAVFAVLAAVAGLLLVRVRFLAGIVIAAVATGSAGTWVSWYLATPLHQ